MSTATVPPPPHPAIREMNEGMPPREVFALYFPAHADDFETEDHVRAWLIFVTPCED